MVSLATRSDSTRPTCPRSCSPCKDRPCPQGEHIFCSVIWFCQLTKGQLIRFVKVSVNSVCQLSRGQLIFVSAIEGNQFQLDYFVLLLLSHVVNSIGVNCIHLFPLMYFEFCYIFKDILVIYRVKRV